MNVLDKEMNKCINKKFKEYKIVLMKEEKNKLLKFETKQFKLI